MNMSNDALVQRIVRDVAELPDRDSPEDWPEAMLVTGDELAEIVRSALAAGGAQEADGVEPTAYLHLLHTFDGPPLEELSFDADKTACFDALEDGDGRAISVDPLYLHPAAAADYPVAWSRYPGDILDRDGTPIGSDEMEVVWGRERPAHGADWAPLYFSDPAHGYFDPATAQLPPTGSALQKLGGYLATLLDEDRWATAEQYLFAAVAEAAHSAPIAAQEAAEWKCPDCGFGANNNHRGCYISHISQGLREALLAGVAKTDRVFSYNWEDLLIGAQITAAYLSRTAPAPSELVEASDSRCNYTAFAGHGCNKCGRIHDGLPRSYAPSVGEKG